MQATTNTAGGAIVPTLRYRDLGAAIAWLCEAFGFEEHLVIAGENGSVRYAQLTYGEGMIMLGPVGGSAFDELMTQPADTGGSETQICYLFVADARAHYERAKSSGAEIILDLADGKSQGRGYSCRDLEGHIWNFGTYDPWKRQSVPAGQAQRPPRAKRGRIRRVVNAGLALTTMMVAGGVVGWVYAGADPLRGIEAAAAPAQSGVPSTMAEGAAKEALAQLARERVAREVAERSIREMREQLARERSGQDAAQRGSNELRERLAGERSARDAAERTAAEARARLSEEQANRQAMERAASERWAEARNREDALRQAAATEAAQKVAREMRERLSALEQSALEAGNRLTQERSAREAVERAAQETRAQLARERDAREAAERSAKDARDQLAKTVAGTKKVERPRARVYAPSNPSAGLFGW